MIKIVFNVVFLAIFIMLFSCKQEDKTVSFPSNIFVEISDSKGKPLDSASICIFDNFNNYQSALATYDSRKSLQTKFSKNGKASFENIVAGKQYWIFCFKKIDSTQFEGIFEIADNFAVSNVFSIIPQKGTDNTIEVIIAPSSGIIIFSFLGDNLTTTGASNFLDSTYKIGLNNSIYEFKPYKKNNLTTIYPLLVRKNIPFSFSVSSTESPCTWIVEDTLVRNDITVVKINPCPAIKVGFFYFQDAVYGANSTISGITIDGIDMGNIVKIETNNVNNLCNIILNKYIFLFPGNHIYIINKSQLINGRPGAVETISYIRDFVVNKQSVCVNNKILPIEIK